MAKRKRTKKEAQARIPRTPRLPGTDPRIKALNAVLSSAELGARALIELDPLNRLADGNVEMTSSPGQTPVQRLAAVVNDPMITIDEPMMRAINEPSVAMANNGEVLVRANGGIDSSFARDFRARATTLPKRKGKKNPKLARAFREANARYRLKNGKLRKGRTQADIARLAHRLLKKM